MRPFVHSQPVLLVLERDGDTIGSFKAIGSSCGSSRCSASRKVMPRSRTIFVRPGDGVDVISHDRIAKKYATIAISAVVAIMLSLVTPTPAPDKSNIARNSLGVMARCWRLGASMLSNAFNKARTEGRK